MSEEDDKEFDPTPRRKEQARKEGKFARSRDAGPALALGLLVGAVGLSLRPLAALGSTLVQQCWHDLRPDTVHDPSQALRVAAGTMGLLVLPPALFAAVVGVGVGLAQAGLRLDWDLVSFKPERLNPMPRLQQLATLREPSFEAAIALLRVAAVGAVGYRALREHGATLLTLSRIPLRGAIFELGSVAMRVAMPLIVAFGVLAAAEYGLSWYRTHKSLRMSRKEIMDEQKSEDGDPKVKGRMRARARALARTRSLKGVKDAAVVITNPTHVAVALRYTDKDPAPVVVAKGHDALALQIRAEARRHRIPIVENRRLARAIDKVVRLGQPVPAEHFAAVAKVLAYVLRLRGPALKVASRRP